MYHDHDQIHLLAEPGSVLRRWLASGTAVSDVHDATAQLSCELIRRYRPTFHQDWILALRTAVCISDPIHSSRTTYPDAK